MANLIATLALGAFVVFAVSLPATASAASLVAPANGAELPLGTPPAFVLKDARDDIPTLEVSASPQVDANGVFTDSVWSTAYESRPGGGDITVTPERSSSPDRFWNKAGTYYWHAYTADCPIDGSRPHTCTQRVITPTRRFTIAPHALVLGVTTPSRIRLGHRLTVRIRCSYRCHASVTVLVRGRRRSLRLSIRVTARDGYGHRATQRSHATLLP